MKNSRRGFLKIGLLAASSFFLPCKIVRPDWALIGRFKKWNETLLSGPVIKIVGVGGAGGCVLNHIKEAELEGIEYVAINTDPVGLESCKADKKVLLQPKIRQGFGISPEEVRRFSEEAADSIAGALGKADHIFIVAGMGGATGTGASPVVAKIAKSMGIFTMAVVGMPFKFEGMRLVYAQEGLSELRKTADAMIVVPNERLLSIVEENATIFEALRTANDVFLQTVKALSNLFLYRAEVKKAMAGLIDARVGVGKAKGKDRALKAALSAISCPLLDSRPLNQANRVLLNITGGMDTTKEEVKKALSAIVASTGNKNRLIWGASIDTNLNNEVQATIIST